MIIGDNRSVVAEGFTLLEVLIAMVILTFGLLSIAVLLATSIRTSSAASNMNIASSWATDRIEILLSRPYDCSRRGAGCHDLDDVDGDGTGQDTDGDGEDDVGADIQFGLDDAGDATADGRFVSPDGRYRVYWNVALDTPILDTKTIRVLVVSRDGGVTKTIPLTYIKAAER